MKTKNIIRDDARTKNYHEGTKKRNHEKLTTKTQSLKEHKEIQITKKINRRDAEDTEKRKIIIRV